MVVADIKVSPFKDHFWHFQIKIKFGKKIRKNGSVRLPDDVFFWIIPLSSFNLKGFYYSYTWSCSLCEGKTSFCTRLIFRKLCGVLLMFSTCFTSLSVLLFFLSIDHLIGSSALLNLFISSDASICSTLAFPPLGNSDHVVSVSIDLFIKFKKVCPVSLYSF